MTERREPSSPHSVSTLPSAQRAAPPDVPLGLNDGANAWGEVVHNEDGNGDSTARFSMSDLDVDDDSGSTPPGKDGGVVWSMRKDSELDAREREYRRAMRSLLGDSPEAAQYASDNESTTSGSDGDSPDGASSQAAGNNSDISGFLGRLSPSRVEDMERADLEHTKLTRLRRFCDGPQVVSGANTLPPPTPLYIEFTRDCSLPLNDSRPPSYMSSIGTELTPSAETSTVASSSRVRL